MPKILSCLVVVALLSGCAVTPEKRTEIASQASSQLAKSTKSLSSYRTVTLSPIQIVDAIKNDGKKGQPASDFAIKFDHTVGSLAKKWSASPQPTATGEVVVAAKLTKFRIVSGGARFWAGAFAGSSEIDVMMTITDKATGQVLANPTITKASNPLGSAWTGGQRDQEITTHITDIAVEYLKANY